MKVLRPYVLEIHFSDGERREVNLEQELSGDVFKPLKDPKFFALAVVEGGTVSWPNGADFAPEFLYHDAKSVTRA